MTMTFEYRSYRPILSILKAEKILTILTLEMGPPSYPKVVPWDQLFFLLKKPLYTIYFGHMNRGHFPKKAKSGKPVVVLRFWVWVIKISILGHL